MGIEQHGSTSRQAQGSTILAVHSGALGDCILFGHLLSQLDGLLTLVAGGTKGRLLAGVGVVGRTLDFEALPMGEVFSDVPPAECKLPELLGSHERLLSCFAAGNRLAEQRLAAMCKAETAAFLPTRPPAHTAGHLLKLWADMLGLDAGPLARPPAWGVPDAWRLVAARKLQELNIDPQAGYLVVHPGAGAAEKCWPLERYAELGERVRQVLFVIGPVEADRWPAERIRLLEEKFTVLSCPELGLLAGVLAGGSAFVGNDGGAAHLSAAVGAPTLTLFGPSRAEHFAPRGRAVRILAAEPIETITTNEVLEALQDMPR